MTRRDYPQMARDINTVGLDNLRRHIRKYHPAVVSNMERNIAIIKYCVRYGSSETGRLYGLSDRTVRDTMARYWRYAKEALDETERICKETSAAEKRR